jgi:hypothetical protein
MAIIKVLAGELLKGQQRIEPQWVKSAELQTEESLKKLTVVLDGDFKSHPVQERIVS